MRLQQLRRSAIVALLLSARHLSAQAAATVPASSTIYDRLESVSAFFPAKGVFLGERALSRRELLRVSALLSRTVDSATNASEGRRAWAHRELELITTALADTHDMKSGRYGRAGLALRADVLTSNAEAQRIESNGQGSIDAETHPFAPGRFGLPLLKGTTATLAPTGLVASGEWFAAVVQPAASLTSQRENGWVSERLFHRAYARGVFFNVGAQVGAEENRWGQSPRGALFISGNAMPAPAFSLSTDTAITLPWWLRYAGRFRATAFLADLGGAQVPPHARLAGWQASIQPWARFELGVAVTVQTGGNGGPKATFLERVVDFFPVIDALAPQHADLQISNKLAGGNLRLRFPELSGADFYYELQIDDFDGRRLRSSMVDDAAHLLGLRVPILTRAGEIAWRAEWHRTALRLYEHSQFVSGSTYRDHIIGSPLGPHAAAGYLSGTWRPSVLRSIAVVLADERRDPAQYRVDVSGPNDRGFTFVRLTDDPDFRRRRALMSFEQVLPGGAVQFTLGYNRAWRTASVGHDEWLGLVTLSSQRLTAF